MEVDENEIDKTNVIQNRKADRLSIASLRFPRLTLGDIESALLQHASNHFRCRKKFLEQMEVRSVQREPIYMYKLETFGEMRTKGSSSVPFDGVAIDSDRNGSVPGLWDIPVHPPSFFRDAEKVVGVPHTEYVTKCTKCGGSGFTRCRKCAGSGKFFCEICRNNGPQMYQGYRCFFCKNWGNEGFIACCEMCGGRRELKCSACRGSQFLKHCDTLCVNWLTKVNEVIHKETVIPIIKLREAIGTPILDEENETLHPLRLDEEPSIHSISASLIGLHSGAFPYILKQRHSLRSVPLIIVTYAWKGRTGVFWLYGLENRAFFKKYPHKWPQCRLV